MRFAVTLYNPTGPWTDEPAIGDTEPTDLVTVYLQVDNISGNVGDVTSIKDANGTELIITTDWVSTDNKFNVKTLRPATHGGVSFHLPIGAKTILSNLPTPDASEDLNWWYGDNRIDELSENLDTGYEGDEDVTARYVILSKVSRIDVAAASTTFGFLLLLLIIFLVVYFVFYVFFQPKPESMTEPLIV